MSPPVASSRIDQAIRTGFLETPALSPEYLAKLAETIPSWLAAADSWGAQKLSLYCENELRWYRENLDIMTPIHTYATVAGLAKDDWLKSNNKIHGSPRFCSKMVTGLESLGITTSDKIIITSNGTLRKLKLSFKFLRISHSSFGGCTNTVTSVGFSKGCGIQGQSRYRLFRYGSCMPGGGWISFKCTASMNEILTDNFIVPSMFSKTSWVHRRLTDAEV